MVNDRDADIPMPEAPQAPEQDQVVPFEAAAQEPREEEDRKLDEERRDEEFHFGVAQAKLTDVFRRKKGWYYHWILDKPGRLAQAQAGGYVFVLQGEVDLLPGVSEKGDIGSKVSYCTGTDEHGNPQRSYLMRIPEDRRQRAHNKIHERDEAIRKAILGGKPLGQGGVINSPMYYSPKEGSRMSSSNKLD